MAALHNFDLVRIVHERTNVTAAHSGLRQRSERIYRCQCPGRRLDALRFRSHLVADDAEEFGLKLKDPLFRPQYFFLPILQLRGSKAFRICERLSSLIIGGNAYGICLRDLNVVAEDAVVSNSKIAYAALCALGCFERGDSLLGIAAD